MAALPAPARPPGSRRLVVLGDSLTFHGPEGPLPLADPRLYPNALGSRLGAATGDAWEVVVIARTGFGVRELWLALQRDVHLQQQVLVGADAVVMGVGSMDTATVGLPRPVTALLPFVRPTALRRRLRWWLDRWHPRLVRLSRERFVHTPRPVYRHCWRKSVEGVRLFAPGAALCAVVPALHAGPYYAYSLRHHPAAVEETVALAAELEVPLVDLPALTLPWLGRLNPDGLHWCFELHECVAEAMAAALLAQLPPAAAPGEGG